MGNIDPKKIAKILKSNHCFKVQIAQNGACWRPFFFFLVVDLRFSRIFGRAGILCVDKIRFSAEKLLQDLGTGSRYRIEVQDRGTGSRYNFSGNGNFGPAGIRRGFPPPPHRRTRSHPPSLAHMHMSSRLTLIHPDISSFGKKGGV